MAAKKSTPKDLALEQFKKDYTALKGYMLGRGYTQALKALTFAGEYHTGTRKNGYTPEFHHQLIICFTIINLRGIESIEEACLVRALLHDVMEDYDVSIDEMTQRFDEEIATDVYTLSKKHRGEVKTLEAYHKELALKPTTIIVKGADNSHNVQSMHGAFTAAKIAAYLADTKAHKLPLLRKGRKLFPEYYFAFTGLSFMLKRQVELYEASMKLNEVQGIIDATRTSLLDENSALKRELAELKATAVERTPPKPIRPRPIIGEGILGPGGRAIDELS